MGELLTVNAIKNRLQFMAYKGLWEESKGKEANPMPPIDQLAVMAPACCLAGCCFTAGCPQLGCPGCKKCEFCEKCKMCPGCEFCNMGLFCDFACTVCAFGIDVCDGLVAMIMVVGKASVYTERLMEAFANQDPNAPPTPTDERMDDGKCFVEEDPEDAEMPCQMGNANEPPPCPPLGTEKTPLS